MEKGRCCRLSVIYSKKHPEHRKYLVSQILSDGYDLVRNSDQLDSYFQMQLGVLGFSGGKYQSNGIVSTRATGGSYGVGLGSEYCVANTTIPFSGDFGAKNQSTISGLIAIIQNKLSVGLSGIQGKLPHDVEVLMRKTAVQTEAIRQAKDLITRKEESVDEDSLRGIVRAHKGEAAYTMSLTGGVRVSWSCDSTGKMAEWARSKGYRKVANKDILAISAQEKGLKKIYLPNQSAIDDAQEFVYGIGSAMADFVPTVMDKGWSNDVSLTVLTHLSEIIPGDPNGAVKQIADFTPEELVEINTLKNQIVEEYDKMAETFS